METKIENIIAIAEKAGQKILEIYHNDQLDWELDKKADNSPLTIADKEAHQIIEAQLLELYPNIPVLSEESAEVPYEVRKNWSLFWMVDPLDGTKEFIKKNGEFTVNIALIENGRPILGVVYVPVEDKMYYASKGEGAFLLNKSQQPLELKTYKKELSDTGLNIVCSRSHMNDETKEYIAQFNEPELVSKGSSLKFMLVAEGNAQVYPRIAPTMEWDTAASQIIVEEAGGKVMQFKKNEALVYNKENLLNPYFEVYA